MDGKSKSNKKKMAATIGVILFLAVYFLLPRPKTDDNQGVQPNNEFVQQIESLSAQPVPEHPMQQAVYYAQLGQNYEGLYDIDKALEKYLQAQVVVDKNNLQQQIVYYEDIARVYEQKGEGAQAKLYLQKQREHLQVFLDRHPEDETTQQAIESIDKRIKNF